MRTLGLQASYPASFQAPSVVDLGYFGGLNKGESQEDCYARYQRPVEEGGMGLSLDAAKYGCLPDAGSSGDTGNTKKTTSDAKASSQADKKMPAWLIPALAGVAIGAGALLVMRRRR